MTEQQITERLSTKTTRSVDVATWHAPANADARRAFVRAMRGKYYDYDNLLDAWTWFLDGWRVRA